MSSYKSQATVLGILFVAVMITWSFGFALISPIINANNFLIQVNERKTELLIGILFEFSEILCVVGIIAAIYPIMEKFNRKFALWYSSLRILEAVTLLITILSCIILFPISDLYVATSDTEFQDLVNTGKIAVLFRERWSNLPISVFYGSSVLIFQYFLLKTRLVPKFISIWGILSALLVLLVAPFEVMGYEYLGFIGISMGLNEIFLGIWLIVRGFNDNDNSRAETKNSIKPINDKGNRIVYPLLFFRFRLKPRRMFF